jgi:hypothetical protein
MVSGKDSLAWEPMLEAFKATSNWQNDASITYKQPVNASAFGKGPLAVSRLCELFTLDEPLVNATQAQLDADEIDFVSGRQSSRALRPSTTRSAPSHWSLFSAATRESRA